MTKSQVEAHNRDLLDLDYYTKAFYFILFLKLLIKRVIVVENNYLQSLLLDHNNGILAMYSLYG